MESYESSTQHAKRVCIVGSGGTGAEIAKVLAGRGYGDLSLIDLDADMAVAKSIDIGQAGALVGEDVQVQAGSNLALMQGADILVITAGRGRQFGEPREAMLRDNAELVGTIASNAAELCPRATIIVLTNPVDLLTHVAHEASHFPLARVLGQGGVLDSARLSSNVARALGVSVKDVRSLVLGGHGDSMVPVLDFVSIHGVPAKHLLSAEDWQSIVRRTRQGGDEILRRLRTHGASVTPGLAVCEMIDALCRPVARLLPVSTMCRGEYGLTDVFLGLPALVSHRGLERVVEIPLPPDDLARLRASADMQRQAWSVWQTVRA